MIRKAAYFDGICNGRIEILVSTEKPAVDERTVTGLVEQLSLMPLRIMQGSGGNRRCLFEGALKEATRATAKFWAQSSVAHGNDPLSDGLRSRRMYAVVESGTPIRTRRPIVIKSRLYKSGFIELDKNGSTQNFDFLKAGLLQAGKGRYRIDASIFTPTEEGYQSISSQYERGNSLRNATRYLRTYSFRLIQNIELLSIIMNSNELNFEDDAVQDTFNEYSYRVNRSRQRLEDYAAGDLIRLGYASCSALYPGGENSVRTKLISSNIRPNIRKKLLALLEYSEQAINHIHNDHREIIMGDKYDNIDAKGDGIAIGRGTSAVVNKVNSDELAGALSELAMLVASSGREDAAAQAVLVETAAEKAKEGDEEKAGSLLKSAAGWVLDAAKTIGSAALAAFIKSKFG